VVLLYTVSNAKQLASNWIWIGHGDPTQVSGGEQAIAATAGRTAAAIASVPKTAATPRILFIRRTSSVAVSLPRVGVQG
jgi:hypothetical protein